jgi:hypothetical protein
MPEHIDMMDKGLPHHTLEGWIDAIRQYQEHARRESPPAQPAWESLSRRERLARIRSIRGKYKDILSPSAVWNRIKQDEIDRE